MAHGRVAPGSWVQVPERWERRQAGVVLGHGDLSAASGMVGLRDAEAPG